MSAEMEQVCISDYMWSQWNVKCQFTSNQGWITPRRRTYRGWQPPSKFFIIFPTISRPSFKAIQEFWGKLWMLEWSKVVISYWILSYNVMEWQDIAYIELKVKLHHGDGIKEYGRPFQIFVSSQLYQCQVSKRFGHFGVSYECWNGAKL